MQRRSIPNSAIRIPNSPLLTLGMYYRHKLGHVLHKIPVNAGLGCPHGACAYCEPGSFSPVAGTDRNVREQIAGYLARSGAGRGGDRRYLVYFQPGTNTAAEPATLRSLYGQALGFPVVEGVCIGTRPDAVDAERLELIRDVFADLPVREIELGLQSSHAVTLRRIGRGHGPEVFAQATMLAARTGLTVGAHVILYLPGETEAMMLETADFLNALPVTILKIHSLYIPHGTPLYAEHLRAPLRLPSLDEYVDFVCRFIRRLRSGIVISRVASDVRDPTRAVLPWHESAAQVLARVRMEFQCG